MRKIIIASHHNLAQGMKDTIEYIIPNVCSITAITAYTNNVPIDKEIENAFSKITDKDDILIFTDLLGGSVNQSFIKYLTNPNVHIITGMNLPIIISCLLSLGEDPINSEKLGKVVKDGQEQIIYVNDYIVQQQIDDNEEDE